MYQPRDTTFVQTKGFGCQYNYCALWRKKSNTCHEVWYRDCKHGDDEEWHTKASTNQQMPKKEQQDQQRIPTQNNSTHDVNRSQPERLSTTEEENDNVDGNQAYTSMTHWSQYTTPVQETDTLDYSSTKLTDQSQQKYSSTGMNDVNIPRDSVVHEDN